MNKKTKKLFIDAELYSAILPEVYETQGPPPVPSERIYIGNKQQFELLLKLLGRNPDGTPTRKPVQPFDENQTQWT